MGVSLAKGQTVSLQKSSGGSLTRVRMGLGWDAVKKRGFFGSKEREIDLDASVILFDGAGQVVDLVWYGQLKSRDGSVLHTGDNLTGAGDGDDESIKVDLTAVPSQVTALVFTVNSFSGQGFSKVENAFCRLLDEADESEIARYDLTGSGPHTAQVMAKVVRAGGGWQMTAIGALANGRDVKSLVPAAQQHL